MAGTVFDSSVLIDALLGETIVELERALKGGNGVVPPLVVAELVTGARTVAERAAIGDLLQELSIHDTPLDHWIAVGELRRTAATDDVSGCRVRFRRDVRPSR